MIILNLLKKIRNKWDKWFGGKNKAQRKYIIAFIIINLITIAAVFGFLIYLVLWYKSKIS